MSLKNYILNKLENKFVRNFLTLFTGSVLGQAILFGFSPILTRLYSKEIFGILFTFASLSTILQVIASLRFEMSIVLPKKDKHAINLFVIAMVINLILNLFFFLLTVLLYDVFRELSGENDIGIWFYFVPLSSFLIGSFEIISSWNNRIENYKKISYAKVSKSIMTVGSQLSFKYIKFTANGLVVGSLIGQFLSVIFIFVISLKSIIKNLKYFSVKRTIVLVKRYKDIPLYNTLIGALNTLSNQIPFLLLGKYFGAEIVALYGMAARVIMTPIGLIAQSIGTVFYKTASDIVNNKGDIYSFVKKTYLNLAKLIAVPVILIFIATFFFEFVFGEGWGKAGLFAAILLPWLTIAFLNNPVSWIITVLNKQKTVSMFDLILLIFRFLSIYLAHIFLFDDVFAIAMYSLTGFLFGIFMLFYLLHIAKTVHKTY